ncbi:MAG: hypothetical protein NC920_05565, partial [Candidatus Omnitrophica bacterium]|nr:hypothetical protein [Candidatus Omnitrophota bacterium]
TNFPEIVTATVGAVLFTPVRASNCYGRFFLLKINFNSTGTPRAENFRERIVFIPINRNLSIVCPSQRPD